MTETKPAAAVDIEALRKAVERSACIDANQWAYSDITTDVPPDTLRAIIVELEQLRFVADSLRNLQMELKGAQLMIFEADTPEKRSKAFAVIGAVVAWIMDAERALRPLPSPPEVSK